jgi:hypothetical protein
MSVLIAVRPLGPVGVAVGGDHVLVDRPAHLDLHVSVGREQRGEPGLLLGGEQVDAGVQGAAGGVERVAGAAAVTAGVLLDAPSALVEGVTGEPDDVERVHHRDRVG